MAVRRKRIPADQLTVDNRVQRHQLNESTLAEIRENYNRGALQTLQVSERPDGTLAILDGWHRWKVVTEKEAEDYPLDCQVHTGLSLAQEAALFRQLNKQKPANKIDLFYVRVTQQDPVALAVMTIANENGWTIGTAKGEIAAVDALETILKHGAGAEPEYGPALLHNTIYLVTKAWGHDEPKTVDKNILSAVGQFFADLDKYEAKNNVDLQFDVDRLAKNLASYTKNGPGGWLAGCRGIADGTSKTLRKVLMGELFDMYNKGKGGRKLPKILRPL
ncbi:DUF6551 family protein [Amycolatopsis rubida]|uniref:ParB/Sulfiredoxin domain-containing protein n=1 Tax=Amycolatopsis rubida TaxID=112413 RepID=A0A1I5X954_9PSEU|nr:DUF6551 family protein [Amycolatopsis rubida]SFQ28366.1 hypothetical protein SAMN05421854_110100 [Amycolatopsis rubida]